jgi:DNA invertase Pin-like site-specific DNA recombinase
MLGMAAKPRVYSYLRFSDPKQAAGTSVDRQLEYAARWAAEREFELDASLSLRDEGLSAFHQRHVKQGALGVFLRAVEDGRIPSGSVLVVEGLDRLSRAEPIQAQAQLAQIVNAGITVVTASDGREYNRARLKAQPMDLVYSLLVMIRAHEESDTKSKRVKAAIRRQCEGWIAGTYRDIIRNGKDPHWTVWSGDRFELVPERVLAVRTAIDLFMQGHGSIHAIRLMTERKLFTTNGKDSNGANHAAHIYRLLRNRALIGEKTLELDGEVFRMEGDLVEAGVCRAAACRRSTRVSQGKGRDSQRYYRARNYDLRLLRGRDSESKRHHETWQGRWRTAQMEPSPDLRHVQVQHGLSHRRNVRRRIHRARANALLLGPVQSDETA